MVRNPNLRLSQSQSFQIHSGNMRLLLLLLFILSACSSRNDTSKATPEYWEQQWLRRDIIGKTKSLAEDALFNWVRNYGRTAGYTGPIGSIPNTVILPSGELV